MDAYPTRFPAPTLKLLPTRIILPAVLPARLCLALSFLAAGLPTIARAQEPALKTIAFTASTEDFPNPERGFHRYREAGAQNSFDIRKDNNTLIFLKLRADAFRSGPLSAGFLANFQAACDRARVDGVKLIPRVAYNDGPEPGCPAQYGCDAPKAVVMDHIAQLAPLWKKNKDVIHILDPGFIGGWGEWHTSSNGLDNKKDMTDILYAILDSLPADRMVYVRYPRLKRDIFADNGTSEQAMLTAARAFDGSRNSRTGHLNDCYLSGADDVGTYRDFGNGWPRSREVAFIGTESQYTPMGGETCALHQNGSCDNALKEMAAMHIDNLNRDFHTGVLQGWKDQGCYDTIARRIGYRFIAESARLPDSVRPGGVLEFSLTLRNGGFGELFNPRSVEVTLSGPGASSPIIAAALPDDPRLWTGGKTATVTARLSVPGLAEGTYVLGLRLADNDKILAADPRYSIRLANQGLWNATAGINELKRNLEVSAKAGGAVHGFSRFEAIGSGVGIRAPGAREAKSGRRSGRASGRLGTPRFAVEGKAGKAGKGAGGSADEVDARGRMAPAVPAVPAAPAR